MKKVLITGASRGLGKALTREFAQRGYQVIATARNLNDLQSLNVYRKIKMDISDSNSVLDAKGQIEEVDIIVNNAAVSISGAIEVVDVNAAMNVLNINVLGTMRVVQAFTPLMRKKGQGLIVNISSGTANNAPPLQGIYAASKAALDRMSEAYRAEVKPIGIEVVQIHSTGIATQMRKEQITYINDYYIEVTNKAKQIESIMRGVLPELLGSAIVNITERQSVKPFISTEDLMDELKAIQNDRR